jgi:hypothetical protein
LIFTYTTAFFNTPPRPYLDIILRNGFYTTNRLVALVDSGADYSIFPNEIAEELKLDLTHATLWSFSGTTGRLQDAKLAEVSLAILKENDADLAFEFRAVCAFCNTFRLAGGVLFGQNGFFSHFKTTFYQALNRFEIERDAA